MRSFSGETANEGASYSHLLIMTASSVPQKISEKQRGGRKTGSALAIKVAMQGLDHPAYAWRPSSTPGPGTAKAQSHSGQPCQGWTCVQFHVPSGAMPTLSFCVEPDSPIKVRGGGGNFPGSPVVKTQPSSAVGRGFNSWSGT